MRKLFTAAVAACLVVAGCTGGGQGGNQGGGNAAGQGALRAQVERLFPYTPGTPTNVLFYCERANSQLQYFFHLRPGGVFSVYSSTDTGQDFTFDGTYTLQNGVLRLQSASFILPLDETSTSLGTAMGMVFEFTTPAMACIAYGHGYNPPETYAHFRCPDINRGPAGSESNALEIAHFSMPFNLQVSGSMFRQRDTWVNGLQNPVVRRGYGIYRRSGDAWYAYFPLRQFDDFDYLSGTFANGGQRAAVHQFGVACDV